MVRKVSPLAYKLDLPFGTKIYLVVSITYFSRYRVYEDLFGRIPPPPGPIEHGSNIDTETSSDDEKQGKHWKLKRIVVHETRRGQIQYLMRWKGYGPQENK